MRLSFTVLAMRLQFLSCFFFLAFLGENNMCGSPFSSMQHAFQHRERKVSFYDQTFPVRALGKNGNEPPGKLFSVSSRVRKRNMNYVSCRLYPSRWLHDVTCVFRLITTYFESRAKDHLLSRKTTDRAEVQKYTRMSYLLPWMETSVDCICKNSIVRIRTIKIYLKQYYTTVSSR